MKDALGPEMVVERLGEDERIGDQRAAGMVSDEQARPLGRDVLKAAHFGAVVDPRRQAQRRQRPLYVSRIAQLEWIAAAAPPDRVSNVLGGRGGHAKVGLKRAG